VVNREFRQRDHTLQHDAMDLTPVFNQVLASHNCQPIRHHVFRLENLEEFLKEAYRIVGHVAPGAMGTVQLIANTPIAGTHCRASHIPQIDTAKLPFHGASTSAKASCANA
jgi:hypothetical protein